MKRKIKSLISFCLALTMLFCMSVPVVAATNTETDDESPSAEFIGICDLLFTGKGNAYDSKGSNVTAEFISKYSESFYAGEYSVLLEACIEEQISEIETYKCNEQESKARTVLHPTYEVSKAHLVTQDGFPYDGKSWYIIVTASGSYGFQDSGSYIISFPSPTISVSYSGLGALFSGSLTSVKTTAPTINSSKTAASFTVTTVHTVSCPIPGVDYVTGTLGPFTNVSSFTVKAN